MTPSADLLRQHQAALDNGDADLAARIWTDYAQAVEREMRAKELATKIDHLERRIASGKLSPSMVNIARSEIQAAREILREAA